MTETVLSTIDGTSDDERLQVTLCHDPVKGSRLELRQQSWGDGVGWFTQSKIELQPHQLGDLRSALGGTAKKVHSPAQRKDAGFVPRVIHAESA
jgi:hypothetical protein